MSFNWFISVDDHLIEPARLWQERVPERWRDAAPRIVRDGASEFWVYEDRQIATIGLNAVAGKRREEFSPEPITYEDMRAGCYEPAARVADMDQGGVLASMLFPSFPRYCGQVFHEAKDKELALLCVRAWNDFILEELAGAYPGRFIPMMIIPLWSPKGAAAEIERTAALGAKSIAFSENPTKLGLPSIHTDHWDPVFRACEETGFVLSMHVGSSSNLIRTSEDMPTLAFMAYSAAANQAGTLLDWLFSGNFERYPGLKIALSEGSIGWIPYFLERAEQVVDKQRFWASRFDIDMNATHDRGEEKAAARFSLDTDIRRLFKDHVFGTFIEDQAGLRLLDTIGEDNVMLECDYPHSDSTWPDTVNLARKWLGDLPDDVQHKITVGNARRVYDFTPADPTTLGDRG
jgi:predicted TIM-barrel fold metal-dependent hydrolase